MHLFIPVVAHGGNGDGHVRRRSVEIKPQRACVAAVCNVRAVTCRGARKTSELRQPERLVKEQSARFAARLALFRTQAQVRFYRVEQFAAVVDHKAPVYGKFGIPSVQRFQFFTVARRHIAAEFAFDGSDERIDLFHRFALFVGICLPELHAQLVDIVHGIIRIFKAQRKPDQLGRKRVYDIRIERNFALRPGVRVKREFRIVDGHGDILLLHQPERDALCFGRIVVYLDGEAAQIFHGQPAEGRTVEPCQDLGKRPLFVVHAQRAVALAGRKVVRIVRVFLLRSGRSKISRVRRRPCIGNIHLDGVGSSRRIPDVDQEPVPVFFAQPVQNGDLSPVPEMCGLKLRDILDIRVCDHVAGLVLDAYADRDRIFGIRNVVTHIKRIRFIGRNRFGIALPVCFKGNAGIGRVLRQQRIVVRTQPQRDPVAGFVRHGCPVSVFARIVMEQRKIQRPVAVGGDAAHRKDDRALRNVLQLAAADAPFRRARKSRRAKFGKGVIPGKRIACFQRFKFFKIGDQPFCFVRQVAVRAARFSGGVFRRNGELRHVIGGGERIDHLHDCRGRRFRFGGIDGRDKVFRTDDLQFAERSVVPGIELGHFVQIVDAVEPVVEHIPFVNGFFLLFGGRRSSAPAVACTRGRRRKAEA